MKAFERIFLYTVLTILVFYVFLVNDMVESQVAIQEEIKARNIVVVDDKGNEVVRLSTASEGGGGIWTFNENGGLGTAMVSTTIAGGIVKGGSVITYNQDGVIVNTMTSNNEGGIIITANEDGVGGTAMLSTAEGGSIETYNSHGIRGSTMATDDEGGIIITTNKDDVWGTAMLSTAKGGEIVIYNKDGYGLVSISQTEEGHGGIWIYDKDGENPAVYGHKR